MRDRVAVTLSSFAEYDQACLDMLNDAGLIVVSNTSGRKLTRDETLNLCNGCRGIIAGTEIYDKDLLSNLLDLKVISRCGTGKDSIDLETAKRLGIQIYTTPDAPVLAVAELTIGMILALLRHIPLSDRELRNGIWKKRMGCLLLGKQAGIIGFGKIGKKVGKLLKQLGAKVVFFDPLVNGSRQFPKMEFKELLQTSDIISLHLSYSQDNRNFIGPKELSFLKTGALLINCSRGGIVDEDALYLALQKGRLGGAAMDVFEEEPYAGPLKELENVILTPHIGSYAREARIKMEIEAVQNLLVGLRRGR